MWCTGPDVAINMGNRCFLTTFSYSDSAGITLHEFAMQTQANVAIMAGQTSAVPEPATVAMLMGLAVGAVAMVARRRSIAA